MVVALLDPPQLEKLSLDISNIENNTDAELVVVLAAKADSYLYIPTLWAAMIALLIPLLLRYTPYWLEGDDLLLAQYFSFVVAAGIFRILSITMLLVPRRVKHERASAMAHRQFLENNLHWTRSHTGVLLFVSEAEHYVEIIADSGISQFVDDDRWQLIVDHLIAQLKAGKTEVGLSACIDTCGVLLAQYAPATRQKNELANHLIVL